MPTRLSEDQADAERAMVTRHRREEAAKRRGPYRAADPRLAVSGFEVDRESGTLTLTMETGGTLRTELAPRRRGKGEMLRKAMGPRPMSAVV